MFSARQKREVADKIQAILRETRHPELPAGEIKFFIHVYGAEDWSWADIQNNGAVTDPDINPWNEKQDVTRTTGRTDPSMSEPLPFPQDVTCPWPSQIPGQSGNPKGPAQ